MTDAQDATASRVVEEQQQKYGVLIRAWGPDDEPGEARHREYVVEAASEEKAKEEAVEEAKNSTVTGIIGVQDGHDIVEVETYD